MEVQTNVNLQQPVNDTPTSIFLVKYILLDPIK